MCGIFSIVLNNNENIYDLIISGLVQLQNRGYDSAGLSVMNDKTIEVHKYASTSEEDSIIKLKNLGLEQKEKFYIGIGHNRWATHGVKNDKNAHPHLSNNKNFSIVHNGIIENYNDLKKILIINNFTFTSQTDTEVVVNLIELNYRTTNNTFEAIKKTIGALRGTYGLVIQSLYEPNALFCVRNGSPLLVGQNDNCVIVTSEQSGFCNMMKNYITLHSDDICVITKTNENILFTTSHIYTTNNVSVLDTELSPFPYKHWTIKEIYEQPNVVLNSINKGGRIKNQSEVKLGGLEQHIDSLLYINNIIILGCGTSYFAGLYGMYFFKQICEFNTVQVFDGAEFNELDIPKIGNTAFILVSQSGETKDLHRCIEIAKQKNIMTIGIINMVDSLIAREVDCGIYCNAGKEVGVASTKAFTSQVICLSMASLWFAQLQNISNKKRIKFISDLHNLSNDIKNTLDNCKEKINDISQKFVANNMFILGKGSDEYIAKEGSLKIKEISYIHSEGYSSSSLKHGPFALLDENFPVIILNLDQQHRAKTLNCYQEILSRNSPILLITNDNSILNDIQTDLNDDIQTDIILIPENKTYASLLGIIPIQLLAYNISIKKGINPDKPKNLAKVVTVE
jgi:glucosamine--fructose-6-phosphate aminotransferase (isomerizing)